MTQVFSVVDRKVAYMEKSEILQKTEEYVEMNKLTLNTNKTKVIFFSRDNSDFGSILYKNEVLTTKKVADILVFNLTGILFSMSS